MSDKELDPLYEARLDMIKKQLGTKMREVLDKGRAVRVDSKQVIVQLPSELIDGLSRFEVLRFEAAANLTTGAYPELFIMDEDEGCYNVDHFEDDEEDIMEGMSSDKVSALVRFGVDGASLVVEKAISVAIDMHQGIELPTEKIGASLMAMMEIGRSAGEATTDEEIEGALTRSVQGLMTDAMSKPTVADIAKMLLDATLALYCNKNG